MKQLRKWNFEGKLFLSTFPMVYRKTTNTNAISWIASPTSTPFPIHGFTQKCDNIIICQLALQKLKKEGSWPTASALVAVSRQAAKRSKGWQTNDCGRSRKNPEKGAGIGGKKSETKINEATSVSITKLQKQASISLNNNGAWPNPRREHLRLLLNPLPRPGPGVDVLSVEVRPQFLLCFLNFYKNISITMLFSFGYS